MRLFVAFHGNHTILSGLRKVVHNRLRELYEKLGYAPTIATSRRYDRLWRYPAGLRVALERLEMDAYLPLDLRGASAV